MSKYLHQWRHIDPEITVGDITATVYLTHDDSGGFKVANAYHKMQMRNITERLRNNGQGTPYIYDSITDIIIHMQEITIEDRQ